MRTWSRPSLSPAVCESYKILNILDVNFNNQFAFEKDKEHSKWAVGSTKDICCFGDLNHTDSQKSRGGNIICFKNANLAKEMRNAIVNMDSCSSNFLSYM